jgi:hypothetical protein
MAEHVGLEKFIEQYETIWEDPSWVQRVCVPTSYGNVEQVAASLGFEPTVHMSTNFHKGGLPVYVFELLGDKQAALRAVVKSMALSLSRDGDPVAVPTSIIVDGVAFIQPMLIPRKGRVRWEPAFATKNAELLVIERMVWELFQDQFERFAAITNLELVVHLGGPRLMSPRPSEGSRVVHVFVAHAPTGETGTVTCYKSCGLLLSKDMSPVEVCQPAAGRGIVVNDDAGVPAVQIVGDNWFLLTANLAHTHKGTSELVSRLMEMAWQAWYEMMATEDSSCRQATSEEFSAKVASLLAEVPNMLKKDIEDVDTQVVALRGQIAELLRNRAQLVMTLNGFRSSADLIRAAGRIRHDYDELAALEGLDEFWFQDDAFMARTEFLECHHEGKRYEIGNYGIRVSGSGVVSVWCEEPARADGEPHPHLPLDGAPCYGNAGEAIIQAAAELRLADVVRYVIDWLKYGYSPDTALVRIEEWPLSADQIAPVTGAAQKEEANDVAP